MSCAIGRRAATAAQCARRADASEPASSAARDRKHRASRIRRRASTTAASRSRPSVSVPVLSNTTCVDARQRFDRVGPRERRRHDVASAPAAAASAAGVASESAQGHDTTSTANVIGSTRDGSIADQQTPSPAATTQQRCRRTSAATRSASCATAGARIRGTLDQPRERRERASPRPRRDPHDERALAVDRRRASTRVARHLARGRLSPVSSASSTLRRALDDDAVGRHGRARPRRSTRSPATSAHAATVVDVAAGIRAGVRAVAADSRGDRSRSRRPRARARRELDEARDEQQRDEHRHRVVVDRRRGR